MPGLKNRNPVQEGGKKQTNKQNKQTKNKKQTKQKTNTRRENTFFMLKTLAYVKDPGLCKRPWLMLKTLAYVKDPGLR